ncbi:MAG TPA: DUF2442 domain-containing protein [Phycisphaerae bacterium]|nr:DUF2442 domain-containing protein [Phycisphaerae bacterium]
MSIGESAPIFVERAEHAGEFRIRLAFNDGTVRTIDFEPFLRRSRNPLIQAYLDPGLFSAFSIKEGDLVWGDYDLCFPIADLYDGRP